MSHKTVLVIDDSATIRKLVDTHLSPVGYRVVLAPNAEDGLRLAMEVRPDLILLDHQLPGTTGYAVCCQLVAEPELRQIPVVISSTLRKKAYAEYVELDNVVDMLPKPYTEELLRTTVANALETAAMVVASQSHGTAVPEVIHQLDDAALAGSFTCFGLREVIDFLNNGCKSGVLEIEVERARIRLHLQRGRIQAVDAAGIDPAAVEAMVQRLPPSLVNLAPIFRMTIGGRSCAELDGFVQLLDQKVLDPRLMSKLLRFQASMLLRMAFAKPLRTFRFETQHGASLLHRNLPLDSSLLALLVEGAIYDDFDDSSAGPTLYVRRAIRGQNLDRAGLSARHMKLFNVLTESKDASDLAATLGWEVDEVLRVLSAFVTAELVEQRARVAAGQFVVFEPNTDKAGQLRASLEASDKRYEGKVVRDKLAFQLLLKRSLPHTIVFAGDDAAVCESIRQLFAGDKTPAGTIKRIALLDNARSAEHADWAATIGFLPDQIITRPCRAEQLFSAMDRLQDVDEGSTASQHQGKASPVSLVTSSLGSPTISAEPIAAGVKS